MKLFPLAAIAALALSAQSVYTTPGRVLAQGTNSSPDGFYGLKSYRIEEVRLPQGRAFRVIFTGSGFKVRAISPILWANGKRIGKALESADHSEIVAVTSDVALIPDGAALSFSYGETGDQQTLREPIHYSVRPQ